MQVENLHLTTEVFKLNYRQFNSSCMQLGLDIERDSSLADVEAAPADINSLTGRQMAILGERR